MDITKKTWRNLTQLKDHITYNVPDEKIIDFDGFILTTNKARYGLANGKLTIDDELCDNREEIVQKTGDYKPIRHGARLEIVKEKLSGIKRKIEKAEAKKQTVVAEEPKKKKTTVKRKTTAKKKTTVKRKTTAKKKTTVKRKTTAKKAVQGKYRHKWMKSWDDEWVCDKCGVAQISTKDDPPPITGCTISRNSSKV